MITREDIEREYKHGDLEGVEAIEDLQHIGYSLWAAIDWLAEWRQEVWRREHEGRQEAGELNDG
jgi:hypothetical protein